MMLNVMALVFNRIPEQAPFFIKPLLKAISKKVESGPCLLNPVSECSLLRAPVEAEYGVY
jgi:hypothetical protein